MKLVVDTSILFSFFRKTPIRFVIINSKLFGLKLFAPELAIDELIKNKPDLIKYSNLKTDEEFRLFIEILT